MSVVVFVVVNAPGGTLQERGHEVKQKQRKILDFVEVLLVEFVVTLCLVSRQHRGLLTELVVEVQVGVESVHSSVRCHALLKMGDGGMAIHTRGPEVNILVDKTFLHSY